MARVVRCEAAEHRLHCGGVGVDVRHHHQHVPRAQRGVGVEGGEQLVVEDLHLAKGAVGDVKAQAAIQGRVDGRPGLASLLGRAQLEDVVLQLLEQPGDLGLLEGRIEEVDAQRLSVEQRPVGGLVVELVEQAQVVTALLAPGGQQRLGVQVQLGIVEFQRHAGAVALAPASGAQQVLVLDDVRPVVAAGVVHAE